MDQLMTTITGLLNKMTGWIDNLFGFFGLYTEKYSKFLVYALLLWVGSKVFKIKLSTHIGK